MNKTLAIDFDGVIANTGPAKAKFAREELGLDIAESLMKQRYFVELFGVQRGVHLYDCIVDAIYNSERMLSDVPLVANARESIAQLQDLGWRCVVVTSRYGSAHSESGNSPAKWAWQFLQLHEFDISGRNFFNVNEQSKLQVCLDTQAHALLDDDYLKLLPVLEAGIRGYLFTTKTNNLDEEIYQPFLAKRVHNWPHLLSTIITL